MMDQKTWLWRKRSAQKSIDANNEAEISAKGNEEQMLQYDKEAALERTVKNLHEKVASLLCECNAKDNLMVDQAKTAQDAIAGREKAVAELALRNQELEAVVQQNIEANERLVHLNAALKDYRQQLSSLKEEHDQRVSEAVDELERANKRSEEKFTEANKKLENLMIENAQLAKSLAMKEELIEDVGSQMSQATVGFNELISRLDSAEKENGILKYEYRVLERELEIQSRCADVANRQHQESVKRAAKLDVECQKLRLLVKKPTVQVKTKREVESGHPEGLDRRMSFMINRLCEAEEENKILKERMHKREDEIRLLQAEFAQIRCDDSHGNGASRRTMIGDSDMSLMDDFVEMERLAIVSVDPHSPDANNLDSVGKELVPVVQGDAINPSNEDSGWLTSVLNAISEQTCVSKRSFDELLEDIRVALQHRYESGSNHDPVSGYITWRTQTPDAETSSNEAKVVPEKDVSSLKTELESLKESKAMIEDQLENQKLINEDLDHQLSVAKVQINEGGQKISALKVELEDRCHCCEELEATCLELQLQLASGRSDKDVENVDVEQEAKLLQTGWEITTASAKLAECQETIFSIGRQLKALAPPTEATESTTRKKSSQHSCLRDRMVAEDGGDMEDPLSSPKTKEIISTTETKSPPSVVRVGSCKSRVVPGALAIVPSKKRGNGIDLLRKLLFRKKRGNKKKMLTIAA
ncbi:filament-like plant protein 4 [Cynara cardunculus var. scolymus]|uniref:filament-like plant protein 4 n=1 Tax=Cynara cardunculus var. scolymus TaxID=59895 RepID=UPI000D62D6E0|nr:filament-like plant protein 4 [Cynara cardunculus var. scolymus]XP_024960147.1 filament-like plant protein 4 [Cynara cardunculus var. scolymus]